MNFTGSRIVVIQIIKSGVNYQDFQERKQYVSIRNDTFQIRTPVFKKYTVRYSGTPVIRISIRIEIRLLYDRKLSNNIAFYELPTKNVYILYF